MIAARCMGRVRAWLVVHLPAGLLHRPDEILIAVMCLMSGFGALTGVVEVGSVEEALPLVVYRGWGLLLLVGALCLLAGIASMQRLPDPGGYLIRATPVYRLGQRLLFNGGLVYGACLLLIGGWEITVGLIVLFSIGRGVRLLALTEAEGR